jgi:preprotein translocase subunit SecF
VARSRTTKQYPTRLIGRQVMHGCVLAIILGIVVGTSSSIFIASAILLFLGEKRLRPAMARASAASGSAAAQ